MPIEIAPDSAPFISVILTTFNRGRLIEAALESVLSQTFVDWELLIVDDGSTDNTFALIKPYVLRDARIRYHFCSNRKQATARNIGLAISTGKYITFLDSDDTFREDHLALRAEYLNAHPEIELLHGGIEIIGPEYVADRFDPSRVIHLNNCTIGGTFVIRRDLVEKLNGFRNIPYSDDNDFFHRAVEINAVIHKIDFPTYRYNRLEEDSICNRVAALQHTTL